MRKAEDEWVSHQEEEKEVSNYKDEVSVDKEEEIGDYGEKEQNGSHENRLTLMGTHNRLSVSPIRSTIGKQFDIITSHFSCFNRTTYSCFGLF